MTTPIAGWSVLMTWQASQYAINESYIWSGTDANPTGTIYPAAKNLMMARSNMMGFGVKPIRMRLSKIGSFRVYYNAPVQDIAMMTVGAANIQILNPATGPGPAGGQTVDGSSDQAKAAIIVDFYDATFGFHSRKFLAGVPDVMIRTDPDGPWLVGDANWGNLFTAWANLLTNTSLQWQFKATPKPTLLMGATYYDDPTTLQLVIQLPTIGGTAVVGGYIQLRNWKMKQKVYQSPNGIWQIGAVGTGSVVGTSTYLLRGSDNVATSQILVAGTVNTIGTGSAPFFKVQLGKQTTRQRGNRSLAAPGRRLKRVRVSA
jgi:hypothetical protein